MVEDYIKRLTKLNRLGYDARLVLTTSDDGLPVVQWTWRRPDGTRGKWDHKHRGTKRLSAIVMFGIDHMLAQTGAPQID